MKKEYFNWNNEKNEELKRERGISFEDIVFRIKNGNIIAIENNTNYKSQKLYYIEINNYVYVVPCIEENNELFLKTVYPSRKATKKYLKKE